jgi:hypothetical protein
MHGCHVVQRVEMVKEMRTPWHRFGGKNATTHFYLSCQWMGAETEVA